MNRVGIVTFFRSVNHGAVLQAFALQKVISKLGHECVVVDYRTKRSKIVNSVPALWNVNSPNSLCRFLIDAVILGRATRERIRKADEFVNENITLSRRYSEYSDLLSSPPKCDVFVCGSDQVWNPQITELDPFFTLDFLKTGEKRISYAASFGVREIPDQYTEGFRNALNKFAFISVRESEGADIVAHIVGRSAEVVLDPTLLIPAVEWCKYSCALSVTSPYILCHSVGGNPGQVISLGREVQKTTGYPIVFLDGAANRSWQAYCHSDISVVLDAGPIEFLSLFRSANFIVTASFHGAVFSILNEKPFVTVTHTPTSAMSRSSRISSLLNALGLSSRLVSTGTSLSTELSEVNYSDVNARLLNLREKSLKFLESAIA